MKKLSSVASLAITHTYIHERVCLESTSPLSPPHNTHPLIVAQVPVWQLCSQTRCPSYLQRQRIMLLEKSDSATSFVGFTTTWGEGNNKMGDLVSELMCQIPCISHVSVFLFVSLIFTVTHQVGLSVCILQVDALPMSTEGFKPKALRSL